MKRVFATSILIFFIFEYAAAQVPYYIFDSSKNSKEAIRQINARKEMVYNYNYSNSEIKDSSLLKINYYDSLGNMITSEQYDSKSQKFLGANSYVYNTEDKLIISFFTSEKEKKNISTTYYEYDSVGNEVKVAIYADTTLLILWLKTYNDKNQQVSMLTKNFRTGANGTINFFYNKEGSLKKKESLNGKNNTSTSTNYYYKKIKKRYTQIILYPSSSLDDT